MHQKHRLLRLRPGNGAGMSLLNNHRQHAERAFRVLGQIVAGMGGPVSNAVRKMH
jgi:hypothetical protein